MDLLEVGSRTPQAYLYNPAEQTTEKLYKGNFRREQNPCWPSLIGKHIVP